jgi:hypothetical protein
VTVFGTVLRVWFGIDAPGLMQPDAGCCLFCGQMISGVVHSFSGAVRDCSFLFPGPADIIWLPVVGPDH